jgi:hypothetical protein
MCNVSGAQVFLAGQLVGTTTPNLMLNVRVGNYPLRIIKPGFNDFNQVVNVDGDGTTVRVMLQARGDGPALNLNDGKMQPVPEGKELNRQSDNAPAPINNFEKKGAAPNVIVAPQVMNFDLAISANVNNAEVIINGNPAGRTPFLAQVPAGTYALKVRAPGYLDYNQNIVVGNGPAQFNVALQPLGYQVSVNSNVQGAAVLVNGQQLGQTPYATTLAPGNYAIIVRATGYLDYQVQLSVNGPQQVNASLMPATASWQLNIPEALLNRQGQRRGMQLLLDGAPQNGTSGQILPGRHVIRFVTGDLAVETQVDIQAGRAYVFEPSLGINVR